MSSETVESERLAERVQEIEEAHSCGGSCWPGGTAHAGEQPWLEGTKCWVWELIYAFKVTAAERDQLALKAHKGECHFPFVGAEEDPHLAEDACPICRRVLGGA